MKRFPAVAVAILTVGSLAFSACGSQAKMDELQKKSDQLQSENDTLNAKVKELQSNLETVSKERDDCKTAAAASKASPTPAPKPTPPK